MSTFLRKHIKELRDNAAEMLLECAAKDYTAYATLCGRYLVLKQLLADAEEHDAEIASGTIKDDDDD